MDTQTGVRDNPSDPGQSVPPSADQVALPLGSIRRLEGFGMTQGAEAYVVRPSTIAGVRQALELARTSGRKAVLRGAGRSYGDASVLGEAVGIDLTRMTRVIFWKPEHGIIVCEPGVTFDGLWRFALEDGWWPPVVPGTMHVTLGGALAMNIHGKNCFKAGTLGEHVRRIEVMWPSGHLSALTPNDEMFYAVISSAGLLGVIVEIELQMTDVPTGDLLVLPRSCRNWDEQFECFEEGVESADYMVSWIDAFAKGGEAGRGLFHSATYAQHGALEHSFRADHQELPLVRALPWLRRFNNRTGMRFVNWAKHTAGRLQSRGLPHYESLVAFSFLLDYVRDWRLAYLPGGFIQYQAFIPKEGAREGFAKLLWIAQFAKLEPYLAVMKRHRSDGFLLSHGVDGYSLALDFRCERGNAEELGDLITRMTSIVLESDGRFYMAKDSCLTATQARRAFGEESIGRLLKIKSEVDPEGLLSSQMAIRLGLVES